MAINFPANPTPNDVFTDGGKSWIWDGVTWKIYSSSTTGIGLGDLSVTTLSVGTAALSYNQSTGVFTYTPPDLSSFITQQYTLPTASTTVLGGVKVDGSSINIDANGVISGASTYTLPTASTTVLGGVKVDGTTITINNGVISGASSVPTSITVANESTDTQCFPLFSTDATGDIAPKTSAGFKLNSSSGQLEAGSFKKTGGTSSEFLKADGSIDSSTYLTSLNLNDLGDVNTTGATNGKILKYDLSTTSWIVADDLNSGGSGGGSSDPVGTIVAWSGGSNSLPTGYQLCDGTTPVTTELQLVVGVGNTVPDLRDRFIIGAGNNYAVDATGGSKDAVVVDHKHTTSVDGGHVIPGVGGNSYSYGGAGTYASTIFSMQNEGVSGTDQNLPPYYALCYVIKHTSATSLSNTFIGLNDTPISHSNGKMLQSNGSSLIWVDTPTGFSGNYNDLTNKPTLFSGSYNDLSNKPTIPSTLNDLSDVDTTGAANGKIIKYNGSSWVIADDVSGSSEVDTLDTVTGRGATTTNAITVGGLSIGDDDGTKAKSIKLGDDDDLTLFYDGRTGYVTSYIESDQMIIRPKTTPSDTFITFLEGGPVQLYHGSSTRISTSSTGASIFGVLNVGDIRLRRTASDDGALYFGDTNDNYIFGSDTDDILAFATNGGEKFRIGSSGQIGLSGANYGTSGQVLTSNGTNSAPTWQTVSSGGSNVQADWNETNSSSDAFIQNKPTLFSGSYNDLSNKPSLFSGAYGDLTGRPTLVTTLGQLTDINITGSPADDSILQYNSFTSEWDVVSGSGLGFSGDYNDLTNKPTIPAAQVNSNWNAVSGISQILNKPNLATVATSGNYNDLSNRPTISGGSPGGSNNHIQFNNSGNFGGSGNFTWDGANVNLRDDYGITLGTTSGGASPLRIYYDGSNSIIHNVTDATHPGDLYLLAGNLSGGYGSHVFIVNQDHYDPPGTLPTTGVMAEFRSDGGQKLHWQGTGTKGSRLETTEYGILLKRTDTSLEGGHIQFEDIQGNSRYAIDVYGTTTANSLLRIIDQQESRQRFCVNNAGAFGIGHVGNEDYGTTGEVLISQGSNSQPIWGTVSGGGGGSSVAGSNKQIQFNDGGSLAGADGLEFTKYSGSGGFPDSSLTLQPASSQTDTYGGGMITAQTKNNSSTNFPWNRASLSSDGAIEIYRTRVANIIGGPHIDFKSQMGDSDGPSNPNTAEDMDARIQMDYALENGSINTSSDDYSAISFQTGGKGYLGNGNNNGNVKERFRIGKNGEIGIEAGTLATGSVNNTRTDAQKYGTAGQVLTSNGKGSSVYWSDKGSGSGSSGATIGLTGVSIGNNAGNASVLAEISATVSNGSKLQFKKQRDTNGSDWTTAYTRIQQKIDVTDQGYIQFNGSDNNYGIELGTTSDQKFIRCKYVSSLNSSVELYYSGNEKLKTTSTGITVTGSVTTQDINMSNLNGDANEVDNTKGSWSIQEGSDDLFIINRVTGKKYKFNLTEIE